MTETVPERLIHSLRTEAPYKHALEIMADDLTQWLRDEGVHDGDIFEHSIILGRGDYPTGRQIIENAIHKMNEAATALEAAQAQVRELEAERASLKVSLADANGALATARREALEEAAKVASSDFDRVEQDEITSRLYAEGMQVASIRIAAAIRALMEKLNG